MSHLRIVDATAADGRSDQENMRAMFEKIMAMQPRALLLVYEADDHIGRSIVPTMASVRRGLVDFAWEHEHRDEDE